MKLGNTHECAQTWFELYRPHYFCGLLENSPTNQLLERITHGLGNSQTGQLADSEFGAIIFFFKFASNISAS